MGYQTIAVCIGVGITLITTLGYMFFQQTRYLTNNTNATGDNFEVYGDENCPICLESLNGYPESVYLNCGHEMHRQCLIQMDNHRGPLSTNTCPMCRTPIRF